MSIDIHSETLLTISQAAQSLPVRPNVSTVWRWIQRGVRGIKLETVLVGGRRYTSKEALQAFIERSTTAASSGTALVLTSRQRERAIQQAEREFDAST